MNEQMNYPNWTDEQWRRVTDLVATEADKARAGARYLPLYGPVDPSVVAVPNYLLGNAPNPPFAPLRARNRLDVDSSPETYLATITIQIPLANHEVAEPELQAASVAFRRAAVTIARLEDALLFNGQAAPGLAPPPTYPGGWLTGLPPVYSVNGGGQQAGLVPAGAMPNIPPPAGSVAPRVDVELPLPTGAPLQPWTPAQRAAYMGPWSEIIVRHVSDTIGLLEANGHSGPFACFLSPSLFEAVHTPSSSMVLPRDRILPFLGGEYLCRSNTIPDGYGIMVAGVPAYETDAYGKRQKQNGAGSPVEIVVATDISLRYLQQTPEPKFLFRIWEKIALRVKEWNAVAVLRPESNPAGAPVMLPPIKPPPPTVRDLKVQVRDAIAGARKKSDDAFLEKIKTQKDKLSKHQFVKSAVGKHFDERDNEIKGKKLPPEELAKSTAALAAERKAFDAEHAATHSNLQSELDQLEEEQKQFASDLKMPDDLAD
jgi:hypothetical protein